MIQPPRQKNGIITDKRLSELAGFEDHDALVSVHRNQVQTAINVIEAEVGERRTLPWETNRLLNEIKVPWE